ncbi:MAG: UvrB/UvrC motif-containing protein [Phycisphaerales bacterium]|nr:UvrB/UvrC motif-containing protein [Planctomycetota bacterium]MCH8507517.1 UvrB/UvrC motif-containing protein [Phycisphaerales bacterium]
MRCERCEREATIHEVIIHKGEKRERHLCEQCAGKAGLSADPHLPIAQLISGFMLGPNNPKPAEGKPVAPPTARTVARCAGCGTTYTAFKESGLLGCPACYDAFCERLGPLIERAHEGACHHVGKFPRRALRDCRSLGDRDRVEVLLGSAREREERLESLRKALAKAVRDEDYERAAMLRDELNRVSDLLQDTRES